MPPVKPHGVEQCWGGSHPSLCGGPLPPQDPSLPGAGLFQTVYKNSRRRPVTSSYHAPLPVYGLRLEALSISLSFLIGMAMLGYAGSGAGVHSALSCCC